MAKARVNGNWVLLYPRSSWNHEVVSRPKQGPRFRLRSTMAPCTVLDRTRPAQQLACRNSVDSTNGAIYKTSGKPNISCNHDPGAVAQVQDGFKASLVKRCLCCSLVTVDCLNTRNGSKSSPRHLHEAFCVLTSPGFSRALEVPRVGLKFGETAAAQQQTAAAASQLPQILVKNSS